jgi:hypothetical protein
MKGKQWAFQLLKFRIMKKNDAEFMEQQNKLSETYVEQVLKPILPNIDKISSSAIGNDKSIDSFAPQPSYKNDILEKSIYEYSKPEQKFIHFTSLEAAKGIISSANFRMFSLYSMSDTDELSFALKQVESDLQKFAIDQMQHDVFTLSMNEYSDEEPIAANMWNQYGDGGFGVGIVFSFDSKERNWEKHFLSKTKYGNSHLQDLIDYHNRHKDFIVEQGLHQDKKKIDRLAIPLAGFHKIKDFESENEVRLLVFNKKSLLENYHFPLDLIPCPIENDDRLIEIESVDLPYYIYATDARKKYIELELNSRILKNYNGLRPMPKIEKIILGNKLFEIYNLKQEFKEKAKEKLGYEIEVETSKINISNIKG